MSQQSRSRAACWGIGVGLAVVVAAAVSVIARAESEVSPPAGFVRVEVPAGSNVLVSLNFDPWDGRLEAVFSNQLLGAQSESNADRILQWDAASQQYVISFKAEGTGDTNRDGHWFYSGTNWLISTQELTVGEGFWIQNRHGDQAVYLCGRLVLVPTQQVGLIQGLNTFGYPYSGSVGLNQSRLAASGAYGATNMAGADRITDEMSDQRFWLLEESGNPDSGRWLTESGEVAEVWLEAGRGYWYERVVTGGFWWVEERPYDDLFGGSNAPAIMGLRPADGGTGMEVVIHAAADETSTVEVLYKDLSYTGTLEISEGWCIAVKDLVVSGAQALVWTDQGGGDRLPVSAVDGRIYLVGRQSVDGDGDGLPDVEEDFVYQTAAGDADSDDDGLGDGQEVQQWGTDPLDADSDDDGMGDGTEVLWGYSPTGTDGWTTLPWEETFEQRQAGDIGGQGGWEATAGGGALVQSAETYAGTQALELVQGEQPAGCWHHFGGCGHSSVWVRMWLRPVVSALPDTAGITDAIAAVVGVSPGGRLAGYDGRTAEWVTATNGPVVSGQWIRVTLALDYANREWRLYSGSELVLDDLGFRDTNLCEFSRIKLQGCSVGSSYVDDISAEYVEPSDLDDDGDGMPNVWEDAHGLDRTDGSDAAGDADGDRLSNLAEYQHGTDPLDSDTDSDGMWDGDEVQWGFDPTASNAFSALPWESGFEAEEGYSIGDLDGQDGWRVGEGTAQVQTGEVAAGEQAAELGGGGAAGSSRVEHYFAGGGQTVVWTDFKVKMVPRALAEPGRNAAGVAAMVAVDEDMNLCGFDGTSGEWARATNAVRVKLGQWLHLTVMEDFSAGQWNLYWDGEPILEGLSFADGTVGQYSRFALCGGSSVGEYLDEVRISGEMPEHIDRDGDGLTDSEEDADGDGVVDPEETDPLNPDSDGDGMSDGAERRWGYDPVVSNSFSSLPWDCGFESEEGYTGGALDTQCGWEACSGVVVTAGEAYEGTNAVRMQTAQGQQRWMTHFFGAEGQQWVWVDLFVRARPGALPDPEQVRGSNSVLVAVDPQGRLNAWDEEEHCWHRADAVWSLETGEWVRLTFGIDYGRRSWNGYVGGVRVFKDIPFADESVGSFSRLRVQTAKAGGTGPDICVDSVSVEGVEPAGLDNDGDGMPNAWERRYGFDSEDPSDASSDDDHDGLTNLGEYQADTDPFLWDTDGDGVADGMEVLEMGADPTSVDITGIVTVVSINGASATNLLGQWVTNGTAIYAESARGSVSYSMDIPTSDVFRLEVEGCAHHPFRAENDFELLIYVDEQYLGRRILYTTGNSNSVAWILTPWLPQGHHTVRIYWDNAASDLSLQINVLRLQSLLGPDANGNGRKDWVDQCLAYRSAIEVAPGASAVSPVCIEGRDPYLSMIVISGGVIPRAAPNDRWYANVPLSSTAATPVVVSFQNGGLISTTEIEWTATDILESGDLLIRRNDALLLTAVPAGATGGVVEIDIEGDGNYQTDINNPVAHTFDVPGTFTVTGIYTPEQGPAVSNTITVTVVDGAFNGSPACWVGKQREWESPAWPPEVTLEWDRRLAMSEIEDSTNGVRKYKMTIDAPEQRHMVTRLGRDGPIIDNVAVNGLRIFSTVETYVRVIETYEDGSELIETGIVMSPVVNGVTVRLEIIVGGITFDDGTVLKELTSEDFDELGQAAVRFVRGAGVNTSVCHLLRAYQGSVLIGER